MKICFFYVPFEALEPLRKALRLKRLLMISVRENSYFGEIYSKEGPKLDEWKAMANWDETPVKLLPAQLETQIPIRPKPSIEKK